MLFTKNILIATACLSISLASIDGQPLPDKWLQISLDETSTDASFVSPMICERTGFAAKGCVAITDFVFIYCRAIASIIDPSNGNCSAMFGTLETLRWTYYSSGRCDTTPLYDTITGAIKHYLTETEHDMVCGTQCLRMDHGGIWDGWLKLGPVDSFNEEAYCGPSLDFDSCLSGDDGDI